MGSRYYSRSAEIVSAHLERRSLPHYNASQLICAACVACYRRADTPLEAANAIMSKNACRLAFSTQENARTLQMALANELQLWSFTQRQLQQVDCEQKDRIMICTEQALKRCAAI